MQRLSAAALLCLPAAAQAQPPSHAEYQQWRTVNETQVTEFEGFLVQQSVAQILPTEQLLRTATGWRQCVPLTPFEIPPKGTWPRAAQTLRMIRDEIVPRIGAVEAVSGYRNEQLNGCVSKAKQSAHRGFWGFDLIPLTAIKKSAVEKSLCQFHRTAGKPLAMGLGFYSGRRFHVDRKGYRRWGVDGTSKTSPCPKI